MIIENKDLKPLIEMTDEEIVAIVRGKAAGKVEKWDDLDCVWRENSIAAINFLSAYRLTPTYTPITVDWSVLDDDIQWISADRNGAIYGHKTEAIVGVSIWQREQRAGSAQGMGRHQ